MENYTRFYALLGRMAFDGDKEELKKSLVRQYTDGRTESLREMSEWEYKVMCDDIERRRGWRDEIRRKRSLCLKLMQKLGVDTWDWSRVNLFCQDSRIAGKPFARLSVEELDALSVKLRAIERSGGLKPTESSRKEGGLQYMLMGGKQFVS